MRSVLDSNHGVYNVYQRPGRFGTHGGNRGEYVLVPGNM